MKILRRTGLLLLALANAWNSSLLAVDRLIEVDLAEFPVYRALWLKKLGPTPFNIGRMMVEPPFAPEYSVSVYSQSHAGREVRYFATYIIADRSLWQVSDVGRRPQRAKGAKTQRIDCEIPREVAEKVRQVWFGMLSGSQRPRAMRAEDAAQSTDATVAEFSIQVANNTLYGEVDADFPP